MAIVTKTHSLLAKICLLVSIVALTGCGRGNKFWTNWWTPGDTVDNVGYHPDQPIEFSHSLHAGTRQIPCQYCHSSARRSATAGIPPLNTCMGCHSYVRTDKEAIQYLKSKWDAKEPVVWTKVHDMPDFVRFTHKPHVLKGIECAECHGEVEKMVTVQQAKSLQMGWCIECHQKNEAPISCATCHY